MVISCGYTVLPTTLYIRYQNFPDETQGPWGGDRRPTRIWKIRILNVVKPPERENQEVNRDRSCETFRIPLGSRQVLKGKEIPEVVSLHYLNTNTVVPVKSTNVTPFPSHSTNVDLVDSVSPFLGCPYTSSDIKEESFFFSGYSFRGGDGE